MSGVDVCFAGNGGREHALARKIRESPGVGRIGATFANGGMIRDGVESIPFEVKKPEDVDPFLREMERRKYEFLVASTDNSVAAGLVDEGTARGFRVFGTKREPGKLESDKAFAKERMREAGIPTPPWKQFKAERYEDALAYLHDQEIPIVVKAPGLALGKGVKPSMSMAAAEIALEQIMVSRIHGQDNADAMIEKYVPGPEASGTAFAKCIQQADGKMKVQLRWLPFARDYKKAFDNDIGENTGGMGAYAPREMSFWQKRFVYRVVGQRLLNGMAAMGLPYNGILYPGLVLTRPIQVYEFNTRWGDPEAQAHVRLLKTDLFKIFESVVRPQAHIPALRWRKGFVVCVVLASEGYGSSPDFPRVPIHGLEDAEQVDNVVIYHAGTELRNGVFYTNGGRVLSVTAWGRTLEEARDQAYYAVNFISFPGMHYRTDIAAVH